MKIQPRLYFLLINLILYEYTFYYYHLLFIELSFIEAFVEELVEGLVEVLVGILVEVLVEGLVEVLVEVLIEVFVKILVDSNSSIGLFVDSFINLFCLSSFASVLVAPKLRCYTICICLCYI